jgi:hypothetical protein
MRQTALMQMLKALKGLAMASGHRSYGHSFVPSSAFKRRSATAVEEATAQFASLLNRKTPITSSDVEQPKINHAFSILANVTQDLQFAREKYINDYIGLLMAHGCDIWRYAEQWTIDLSQPGEIERKMEECIWTSIIIYAVGGWNCKLLLVRNINMAGYTKTGADCETLKYASCDFESLPSILVVVSVAGLTSYLTSCILYYGSRVVDFAQWLSTTGHPRVPRCHHFVRRRGSIDSQPIPRYYPFQHCELRCT